MNERRPLVTCVCFASGSKWGLSTSAELAAGKLVLLTALHSSSLALGNDAVSLTVGQETQRGEKKRKRGQIEISRRKNKETRYCI